MNQLYTKPTYDELLELLHQVWSSLGDEMTTQYDFPEVEEILVEAGLIEPRPTPKPRQPFIGPLTPEQAYQRDILDDVMSSLPKFTPVFPSQPSSLRTGKTIHCHRLPMLEVSP